MLVQIEPPSREVTTSKTELLEFFKTMHMMRRCELAADMVRQLLPAHCKIIWHLQVRGHPRPEATDFFVRFS